MSLICILFFLLTPFGPLVGLRGKQILLLIILLDGLLGTVHGGFFYCKYGPDCFVKACKADMLRVSPGFGV